MNLDEERVFNYLKAHLSENVIWEPDGNVPPDFLIDSEIAIEARRLNQNFFNKEMSEGLEQLSFPIFDVFNSVLKSFDFCYQGYTYWVAIDFDRPLNLSMRHAKNDMEVTLKNFLINGVSQYPQLLSVNAKIEFTVFPSQPISGRLFRPAVGVDGDAGGWVVPIYKKNLRLCVIEKSSKVANYLSKYHVWWLYLVDHMGWGLDESETKDLISSISDICNFDGVFIISNDGETLLTSILR